MKTKILLCLIFGLLLTGCAPSRESEVEKLGEYWHNSLYEYSSILYDEYIGETTLGNDINKTVLIKIVNGNASDVFDTRFFETDHEFAFDEVNLNTMTYKKIINYWYDESGNKKNTLFQIEYNYITNSVKGTYGERIFNTKGNEIEAKAITESFMYNFNTGNSECSAAKGYGNPKSCDFNSNPANSLIMQMQKDFIEKIRLSGVDETLLK